jgi:LysR family transcriptional regulator, chromosome initiation inhibitor
MLDYRGLEALTTVIETQGFEAAANKLHLTQSAISQRIKNLETYYGSPLLIRTQPYHATEFGEQLLGYFKKILLLENELSSLMTDNEQLATFSIALSRDSLETWFMSLIDKHNLLDNHLIDIMTDDQEITLSYLKKGLVASCITTSETTIPGCQAKLLGYLNYVLVCSPTFKQQYFNKQQAHENYMQAPALIFDSNDKLHEIYFKNNFDLDSAPKQSHTIPSIQGFKLFALKSYGYGLIPKIDIEKELQRGELIELYPEKPWKMPVYLHHWDIQTELSKKFISTLVKLSKRYLNNQPKKKLLTYKN